ncbi:C2 domain-containing protein [Plasmodiophora brassicae]|nr:hypothetical protein PBRA_003359 [Plasmodiophora brassicae]
MDDVVSSKLSIDLSIRNFPRMRGLHHVHLIVFVSIADSRKEGEQYIGHTDILRDVTNSELTPQFTVEYYFEENQILTLRAYHSSKELDQKDATPPGESDLIGQCQMLLSDLVSSPTRTARRDLMLGNATVRGPSSEPSRVVVRCEKVANTEDNVMLGISALSLDKTRCCGKPSPVLEIARVKEGYSWQVVHSTEPATRTCDPVWPEFKMGLHQICNNDRTRLLRVTVWDQRSRNSRVMIGQCESCLNDMRKLVRMKSDLAATQVAELPSLDRTANTLALTNPNKSRRGARYKNTGFLVFRKVHIYRDPSFLDYIMGGLTVRLMVAIDFTASNGDPSFPDSLHYIDSNNGVQNPYEHAIIAIGNVLAAYDTDQMFPVWGFGAKLRSSNQVSHRFSLTFDPHVEEVSGVHGILKAYRKTFGKIQLSGPTMFSDIINRATEIASEPYTADAQHYNILLVITDGVVNDRTLTTEKIIEASDKPLSIIIVGVGSADFSDMVFLDSDDKLLEQDGKVAKRDIVQFVAMKNIQRGNTSRLAAEVLAEVPGQVIAYMKMKDISPPNKAKTSVDDTPAEEQTVHSNAAGDARERASISATFVDVKPQVDPASSPQRHGSVKDLRKQVAGSSGSPKRQGSAQDLRRHVAGSSRDVRIRSIDRISEEEDSDAGTSSEATMRSRSTRALSGSSKP